MTATETFPITSLDIRRELLARRLEVVQAKSRNSETRNSESAPEGHDEARDKAASKYQGAINDFMAQAKANAIAKKKKQKKEMVALFILLMLDAGESAYQTIYKELAELQEKMPVIPKKELLEESEAFAEGRKQFYNNFPETVFEKLEKVVTETEAETEKELRAEVNETTEQIKDGQGKTVAETEAQAVYGKAQSTVLQRAGFKTHIWMTMEDERVRKSHVDCGEQGPVKIGKPFVNGLLYPGDPNGPPEELINCRCFLQGHSR